MDRTMSKKDFSPKVDVTISLSFEDCEYPEPTRATIENKLREILNDGNLYYSEKRWAVKASTITKINKEPISSNLDTFGDIDKIMSESEKLQEELEPINKDIPQSHTDKIFTSRQTIGRPSEEQGGSRINNSYSTDRDPLNED